MLVGIGLLMCIVIIGLRMCIVSIGLRMCIASIGLLMCIVSIGELFEHTRCVSIIIKVYRFWIYFLRLYLYKTTYVQLVMCFFMRMPFSLMFDTKWWVFVLVILGFRSDDVSYLFKPITLLIKILKIFALFSLSFHFYWLYSRL